MNKTLLILAAILFILTVAYARADDPNPNNPNGVDLCKKYENWYTSCNYNRPNCPILPGSYCYGAAGWFEYCTGTRANWFCHSPLGQ